MQTATVRHETTKSKARILRNRDYKLACTTNIVLFVWQLRNAFIYYVLSILTRDFIKKALHELKDLYRSTLTTIYVRLFVLFLAAPLQIVKTLSYIFYLIFSSMTQVYILP